MKCTRDNSPTDAKAELRGNAIARHSAMSQTFVSTTAAHSPNLTQLDLYRYPHPKYKTRIKNAGRRLRQVQCTRAEQNGLTKHFCHQNGQFQRHNPRPKMQFESSMRCHSLPFDAMGDSICTAMVVQNCLRLYMTEE